MKKATPIADPFAATGHDMVSGTAPLSKFKPYPLNARVHPDHEIKLLAKLIAKYGPDQSIVVDDDFEILKGHGRLLAAHEAGLKDFPYVQRFGMSAADKRSMRINDNQVGLLASWDENYLRIELEALKAENFDMELIGFGEIELVQFMTTPGPTEAGNSVSLAERFGVVPFSVLNAREGWWQDRKRAWLALGIQSELGRGENLLKFSDTINEPDPAKRAARRKAANGKEA